MVTTTAKRERSIILGENHLTEDSAKQLGLSLEKVAGIAYIVQKTAREFDISETAQLYIFYFKELKRSHELETKRIFWMALNVIQTAVIIWLLVR